MGTNFYCKKIDRKRREEFSENLDYLCSYIKHKINDPCIDLKEKIQEFLEDNFEFEQEIHLGKRSYGWQFLWDYHNGKYFNPNLESIKGFLLQKDIVIYDEYGNFYTTDQLFNDEIASCLYKDSMHDDGMNGEYAEYYFKSDGLRFSKFEDFS